LTTIDFYFSIDAEVEQAQDRYTEQLVRMETMNTIPLKPVR